MAATLEVAIDINHPFAWITLRAAMTWPRDPNRQRLFHATRALRMLAAIESGALPDSDGSLEALVRNTLLKPAGGYEALLNANALEDEKDFQEAYNGKGQFSGAVLCVAAQLHLEDHSSFASLNRAYAVLNREKDVWSCTSSTSRTAFRSKIWPEWACVSHVHAAYLILRNLRGTELPSDRDRADDWSIIDLADTLAWAEWLRLWGINHRPNQSKTGDYLLTPDDTLRLISPVEPVEPPFGRMRAVRLAAAVAYKS